MFTVSGFTGFGFLFYVNGPVELPVITICSSQPKGNFQIKFLGDGFDPVTFSSASMILISKFALRYLILSGLNLEISIWLFIFEETPKF